MNWQCKAANCNENPLDGYYDVTPRVECVDQRNLFQLVVAMTHATGTVKSFFLIAGMIRDVM